MGSPDAIDDETGLSKARTSSTPKRVSAIKRAPNATPQRYAITDKASTPNSDPVRGKSGSRRPESTLLGDFLLGRPSATRVSRRSSDFVKAEAKESTVSKLQSSGAVKDRVRQWQISNAAALIIDPAAPASEPDEILVAVDEESVNEEDRIRIKRRLARHDRRKHSENEDKPPAPEKIRLAPKKRVVSDEHWMNKATNDQSRNPSIKAKPPPVVRSVSKGLLGTTSADSPLERKTQDWINTSDKIDRRREDNGPVKETKRAPADDGIRVKPLPDNLLDDGIRITPGGGREKRKHTGNEDTKDYYSRRRKSEKLSPKIPEYQGSRRNSPSSNDIKGLQKDAESTRRDSRCRPDSTTPPESLADIPVGYSAFSVLDIPVGGDASGMRSNKPQRNPSLSSVPKVLKKVYREGLKIVHETVEPPRVDMHEPPSIESWLRGTSDPFIDHVPPIEPPTDKTTTKLMSNSCETSNLFETFGKNPPDVDDPSNVTRRRRRAVPPNPHAEHASIHSKDERSPKNLNIDRTVGIDKAPMDLPPPSPPPSLKRSPATRNIPSKSSPKKRLRDIPADGLRGERVTDQTKQPLSKSETHSVEPQERRKASGPRAYKLNPVASYNTQDASHVQRNQRMPDVNTCEQLDSPSVPPYNATPLREAPRVGEHRLYSIASVESLRTVPSLTDSNTAPLQTTDMHRTVNFSATSNTTVTKDPQVSRLYDNRTGLKRRLTKHSDLLSILSMPETDVPGRNKSIRSARSVRTTRARLDTATIIDILQELADDEAKYMRELKTLVDGVIPVLLTSVLKKPESLNVQGIFGSSSRGHADASITKPIVDMGVALERLKSLHRRIPLQDANQLLHWALGAHKVYENYLAAWRMGFQDVVVNLAPATHNIDADSLLDAGMPRNHDGDVINGDGERVDVAFLLKRPLVRIKYLARATKGIRTIRPSQQSEKVDDHFQELLELTRRRTKEEGARLEDRLASNTDSTRARDPRTLAAIDGVKIDQTRQVKAKDYFSLDLSHSSGQKLGCEVELLLRDKPNDAGDILICEVDARKDRWLLFPPISFDQISARKGCGEKELVVMIRGIQRGLEWREIITLTADSEENAAEWVEMLGQTPCSQFLNSDYPSENTLKQLIPAADLLVSGTLGADAAEIPIGERRVKDEYLLSPVSRDKRQKTASHMSSPLDASNRILGKPQSTELDRENFKEITISSEERRPEQDRRRDNRQSSSQEGETSISPKLKELSHKDSSSQDGNNSSHSSPYSSDHGGAEVNESSTDVSRHRSYNLDLPSAELPIRSREEKVFYSSNLDEKRSTPLKESMRRDMSSTLHASTPQSKPLIFERQDGAPLPPPHKSSSPSLLKKPPILSSIASKSKSRRSSSPLKHEYQPSDASDTSSASEISDSDGHSSLVSDSSDDEELADIECSASAPEIRRHINKTASPSSSSQSPGIALSNSASQVPNRQTSSRLNPDAVNLFATVSSWSHKGYWENLHPEDCSIVVGPGLIEAFAFSGAHLDKSRSLLMDVGSNAATDHPLVALVLTPVVPLRQSTALDIEIRSPPLSYSKLKCGDTVRFRTRTVEDCRALYAAIHRARLDNPKYKQLEQERILSSYGGKSYEAAVAGNRRRSWFGRQKSYRATIRAPSATASEDSTKSFSSAISALKRLSSGGAFNIEKSSIDTTLGLPLGVRSAGTSIYTSSSDSSRSGSGFTPPRTPTSPSIATTGNQNGETFGHENLKIRLYVMETSSRWNELGAARLTVTHPPSGMRHISALYQGIEKRIIIKIKPGDKQQKLSKRYSVSAPETEEGEKVLLDIILGARCFSRQGIVGVCMNVWEEIMGDHGELGTVRTFGGVSGRTRKYMFQCANATQARWIFALVGNGGR